MAHVDQFVSVTQAKAQLLDLVRQLQKRQDTVGITRDGVPAAVLLSMEHFEGLMETLDILSDSKTIRPLRRSLKQAKAGDWVSQESTFKDESE
jgi:antitoxin YefM